VSRRDPLERIVDLVVAVPLSVVAAARQLVPFDTKPVERRLGALVGRKRDVIARYGAQHAGETTDPPTVPAQAHRRRSEPTSIPDTPAPPAVSVAVPDASGDDALAIDGYDQLSARQIVDRLDQLTADELAAVARYERANRRRQTVLGRIEQLS
jgi:hypothetical protein